MNFQFYYIILLLPEVYVDYLILQVDAQVGKYLFEECISRYLGGKTRILATHQLQFIKEADGIILLDRGKMQYYNNYHRFLEAHPEYNSLIAADKEHNFMEEVFFEETEIKRRFSSTISKVNTLNGLYLLMTMC